MIYCPNCGTSNRKGSHFCSECGEALPSTGTRCPMCGTTNPVSNVYCMACTARLVPLTSEPDEGEGTGEPIKGISLPTIPLDEQTPDREPEGTPEIEPAEDWLDELRESADRDAEGRGGEIEADSHREEAEEDLERADIPDWLQEMGPVRQEPDVPPSMDAFSVGADSEEATPSEDEQPDERLAKPRDVPQAEPESVASEEGPPETDVPEREEDGGSLEPAEIPEWLRELGESGDDLLESVGVPEWLEASEEEPGEAPAHDPETPPKERVTETFELPGWVADLLSGPPVEEDVSPSGVEAPVGDHSNEGLAQGDIPDWLHQLKPGSHDRETAPEEPLETEGVLQGLRGIIRPVTELEAPAAYEIRSAVATSEASRAKAQLLESLLGERTAKPKPGAEKERASLGGLAERGAVAIVVLVTVLGMLLAPMVTGEAPRLTGSIADSEAVRLHGIVEALDATDHVLVAFDYGIPETDELDHVARPVLEHLVESGASISIASTRPDGMPVAAALMSDIAESRDDYTRLGYRPGGGMAVSQLLGGEEELPSLLLVVTGRPGPLVRWVEQAEARYGSDVPVAAVGSALLEPVVSPYVDTNAGQLEAAIHGLRGAASYEAIREAEGEATEHLDTLAAGHIAIAALLLAGAGVYGLGAAGRRH